MAVRYNIQMAGVGGQGVVTSSHIFSTGVINAGGESTIVPFYGSEKRMAPVESYVRVSDAPIYEIGEITFPHIIMIFHPQVITHGKSYTNPFYFGLKQDGVALINHDKPMNLEPDQERELKEINAKLYYLPATTLSLDNWCHHWIIKHGGSGTGGERSLPWKRLCGVRWDSCAG